MSNCCSCGKHLEGGADYMYTCPECVGNQTLEGLRQDLATGLHTLTEVQQRGFDELSDKLTNIATILVWGFHDVIWQMEQQTDVLRRIEYNIGHDRETKANELRTIAEEQKARGIRQQSEQPFLYNRQSNPAATRTYSELLDQAEQRFLESLDLNPLDYSTYVGLARAYMAMNGHVKAPEKARDILQRSLPHAPRKARLKESTKKTPGVESGGGDFEPNRNLHRQTTIREEDIGKYYPNYRKPGGATGSPAETPEHGSRKADQEPEPRIDYERYARLKLPVKKLRLPGQNEPQYLLVPESSNPAMPAPEAPEIDMRSYSYRLIGRTYFCEEQYAKAAEALELAVKLSLEWPDANYDYSQYCALAGKRDECLSWLAKAILAKPIFYYLAQKEISFDPLRQDVEALLRDVKKRASDKAGALVSEAEAHLRQAQEAVRDAEETMAKARQKEGLAPRNLLKPAESCLKDSREKLASADYRQVLDSQIMAAQATAEARQARTAADAAANGATAERRAVLSEQAHSAKGKILGWTFKGFFLGMSAGAIVAVTVGEFGHIEDQDSGPIIYGCVLAGGVLGALAGFLWVYSSYRRSQSELKVLSDRAETRTKKG